MRKRGHLPVVVGLLALMAFMGFAGCAGDEPVVGTDTTAAASTTAPPTTVVEGPRIVTVQEAIAAEGPVRVVGALIAVYPEDGTGGGGGDPGEPTLVLTSALAESYPPQPGGPTMEVIGLDLDDLVGLSTTVGQTDVAPLTWTNYWMVLEGNVTDGVLEVTDTPAIMQVTTPDVRVRFAVAGPPLTSGDSEWWALDVRNEGQKPLDLTFATGQEAEVVLSQAGVEKYRWSAGMLFTEAIKTVTLQPGEVYPVVINDSLDVPPGRYDLAAFITATATVDGQEVLLPAVEGPVDVN